MGVFAVGAPPVLNRVPFSHVRSGREHSDPSTPPALSTRCCPTSRLAHVVCVFYKLREHRTWFMSLEAARTQCVRGGRICFLQEDE